MRKIVKKTETEKLAKFYKLTLFVGVEHIVAKSDKAIRIEYNEE